MFLRMRQPWISRAARLSRIPGKGAFAVGIAAVATGTRPRYRFHSSTTTHYHAPVTPYHGTGGSTSAPWLFVAFGVLIIGVFVVRMLRS